MGLADTLYARGDQARAIEVYEKVLADYPNQPVAVNNLAYLYAQDNKNLYRALEMARRAVANNPQNGRMRDTLGWVCFRAGRHADAAVHLREAVRLLPDEGIAYYHLGKLLLARGERDKAATVLTKALSLRLSSTDKADAAAAYRLAMS